MTYARVNGITDFSLKFSLFDPVWLKITLKLANV